MGIATVEDAIVNRIKAVLGISVRTVEALPGDWDDDMLKRLLRLVPGVFVAFAGGAPKSVGSTSPDIDSQWIVYVVTGHASGEAPRRRGDALQIGAYELIQILVPALHLQKVSGGGTLMFAGVDNLYTGTIDKQGIAVYAIRYQVQVCMSMELDLSTLDDFETFDAQYDVAPHTPDEHLKWLEGDYDTSNPDAHDTVTLPIIEPEGP